MDFTQIGKTSGGVVLWCQVLCGWSVQQSTLQIACHQNKWDTCGSQEAPLPELDRQCMRLPETSNKSKIKHLMCGRKMSPSRELGLGHKSELTANSSGSHSHFIPFTYGITKGELYVSVHVFNASLALLMCNRNKEEF